jgi:hypothetical protein
MIISGGYYGESLVQSLCPYLDNTFNGNGMSYDKHFCKQTEGNRMDTTTYTIGRL